mmetsp:Transcript_310/g.1038  ORF Transcript_310/g.1038 Transcript_310/m.1038 type:complete len:474 (-) Transcript_310:90-1511(-)|eukprot:CAMPEP_0179237480 /NCGR_PEP_ID=MMETSP0797-20121207/14460_1 /TAXON_ID=47934 /ORGANISM="Dinophysis acuminata, Strain DAEP01" /LENGTH=473 /DNA_ID=CAMNT_0020944759 /DNA_START=66 /DNA_END=1487 /DNA_ORIENTATION=-
MTGPIWEVVGGGDKGGVLVRLGRELASPAEQTRLSTGALVEEVDIVGDRLRYNLVAGTGYGPHSGWLSIKVKGAAQVVPADVKPPRSGWKILSRELPDWAPPPPGASVLPIADAGSSAVKPQSPQTPGEPYVFYHQICFNDTKPTGLRMSACLAAMDNCRTDLFTICDMSVESFKNVNDPFTQVMIELRPAIAKLGEGDSGDGLLYTTPDSSGPVLTWLRLEAQFGWPAFPLRTEEQTIYKVGKDINSAAREPIATARFVEAFTDSSADPPSALMGENWERDADKFFAKVKSDHSNEALNQRQIHKMYKSSGKPFTPTHYKEVSWLMSHAYADLWDVLYHARAPELLWDVNMLAGGEFAGLVAGEADPQALAMNLPKGMKVGTVYDTLCFLDSNTKKAMYVLLPQGSKKGPDCVLCISASYNWQTVPQDGATLTSEDLEACTAVSRNQLINFAAGNEAKPTRLLDLSNLPKPA